MQVTLEQELLQAADGVEHLALPRRPMMPILRKLLMGRSATGRIARIMGETLRSGKPGAMLGR